MSHLAFFLMMSISSTGQFKVNNVSTQASGESSKVKVKVRVNGSGIFSVSGATMYEKVEGEEEKEEPMEVDGEDEKKNTAEPAANANGPDEVCCVGHVV